MSGRVERARGLMARPGAWIEGDDGDYRLRLGPDRRSRVVLRIDEADFRALTVAPGLSVRSRGGWQTRTGGTAERDGTGAVPGCPGRIEGERALTAADGRAVRVRANRGESPIAWLARRRDHCGRPWLNPAQVAAGERLRAEAEIAGAGPSLTMRWDALPRASGGTAARVEPGDRAIAASRRVEAALNAAGPRLRPMLVQVCIGSSSIQLAEREQGLRRRQGKTVLAEGLSRLAEHYGMV